MSSVRSHLVLARKTGLVNDGCVCARGKERKRRETHRCFNYDLYFLKCSFAIPYHACGWWLNLERRCASVHNWGQVHSTSLGTASCIVKAKQAEIIIPTRSGLVEHFVLPP